MGTPPPPPLSKQCLPVGGQANTQASKQAKPKKLPMRHACMLYLKDVMGMQVDTFALSQLDRKTGKVIVVKRHHRTT